MNVKLLLHCGCSQDKYVDYYGTKRSSWYKPLDDQKVTEDTMISYTTIFRNHSNQRQIVSPGGPICFTIKLHSYFGMTQVNFMIGIVTHTWCTLRCWWLFYALLWAILFCPSLVIKTFNLSNSISNCILNLIVSYPAVK